MVTFNNGVPVPFIGEVGWGDEMNAWLATMANSYVDLTQQPYGADDQGVVDTTDAYNTAAQEGNRVLIPAGQFVSTGYTTAGDDLGYTPVMTFGVGRKITTILGTDVTLINLFTNDVLEHLSVWDTVTGNSTNTVGVQIGSSSPGTYATYCVLDHVEVMGNNGIYEAYDLAQKGIGIKLYSALEGSLNDCLVHYMDIGVITAVNQAGNRSNAMHVRGGRYALNNIAFDFPDGTSQDVFMHGVVIEGNSLGLRCADTTMQLAMTNCHIENNVGSGNGIEISAGHLISTGNQWANSGTDIVTSGTGRFTLMGDIVSGDIVHNGTGLGRINGDTEVYGDITGTGPILRDRDVVVNPTYGATVTVNPRLGRVFNISVTNSTDFTVDAPDIPATTLLNGMTIKFVVINAASAELGDVTWDVAYGLTSAWVSPAADEVRTIEFMYNSVYDKWFEVARSFKSFAGAAEGGDPLYSPSITINPDRWNSFFINVTNGVAFTINDPSIDAFDTDYFGKQIVINITNASGGAMGAITWGAKYRLSAWTNPANDKARAIHFIYDAAYDKWTEVSRTAADVP